MVERAVKDGAKKVGEFKCDCGGLVMPVLHCDALALDEEGRRELEELYPDGTSLLAQNQIRKLYTGSRRAKDMLRFTSKLGSVRRVDVRSEGGALENSLIRDLGDRRAFNSEDLSAYRFFGIVI